MTLRSFFGGFAAGVWLEYFLDPSGGFDRRCRAAERLRGRGPARYGSRLGDLAGLGAANLRSPRGGDGSFALPLLLAGGLLAAYSITRRRGLASAVGIVGAGLLSRSWRYPLPGGLAERRRVVDIQKTVWIAAPVAEVYAFWDSYDSYPLFLPAVRDIEDLGGGRSHWVVRGPRGGVIEWDALLTRREPERLLAWRSEPGSMLDHAGVIRFTAVHSGTRVDLRICYQSPTGGGGLAVRDLLGADPRATLNQDLARLTAVLEGSARSRTHGQESRS
jgi:uncharacterized membrane protein